MKKKISIITQYSSSRKTNCYIAFINTIYNAHHLYSKACYHDVSEFTYYIMDVRHKHCNYHISNEKKS